MSLSEFITDLFSAEPTTEKKYQTVAFRCSKRIVLTCTFNSAAEEDKRKQ